MNTNSSQNHYEKNKILQAIGEFFLLTIIVLLPIVAIFIDLVILQNNIGEISVTELTQELFLLLTVLIYFSGAYKKLEIRGFLVLVGGFFTALFIREMDAFLDEIFHGFWFYVAMSTTAIVILYTYFFAKGTVLKPLVGFFDTKSFFLLLLGIIILVVFSRTFGSGNLLWGYLLEEEHVNIVKTTVQEGLELLGYTFIFYGSLIFKYRDYQLFKKC